MNSLDPRVNRLPPLEPLPLNPKVPHDQFGTFEVFVQPRQGRPFQHEGALHAPDLELAFVLAKETFTRRFTCTSLFVAETRHVFVSPITEGEQSVYDLINADASGIGEQFEIFHLPKRGKQHIHAGSVAAKDHSDSIAQAKASFSASGVVYNVWSIRRTDIRFTGPDEHELWLTLPDKKFRDAAAYKAGDKLKTFLENR